jgi:uncharacterized oligopeptide transporter (OPT) family protein
MLWSLGLSFIGVFFAVPLREQTIIKEQLKFPSGTATAQMITILHDLPPSNNNQLRRRRIIARQNFEEAHELSAINDDDDDEEEEFSTRATLSPSDNRHVELDLDSERTPHDVAWSLKLRALIASFSLSSTYTLASYFFPVIYALPIFNWMSLNFVDFKAWEWYFTPSLSYIGQGIIMVYYITKS